MIEVQALSRCYGDLIAVDNVSFRIGRGEVVGLLGHNGAGKTTAMKMMSGYLEPSAGTIEIQGLDVGQHASAVQQRLGYLPESLPIYPEMSVADYLDYAASLKGIPEHHRSREVRGALEATDLQGRVLDGIGTLSRGFRQRVGVAQALLGEPDLLILDEPTNGLDPGQTEHMRGLIRSLAQRATVILSTHIMQEVEALCDRVLVLSSGRLVLDAPLADLRQSRTLELELGDGAEQLRPALEAMAGIGTVVGEGGHYELTLDDGVDSNAIAPAVARCVYEGGIDLRRLAPRVRDLETIFREATSGGAAA